MLIQFTHGVSVVGLFWKASYSVSWCEQLWSSGVLGKEVSMSLLQLAFFEKKRKVRKTLSVIIYCHLLTRTTMNGFKHQHFIIPQNNLLYPSHMHNKILLFCDWSQHMSIPCFFSFNTVHLSYTAVTIRGKITCSTISMLSQSILPQPSSI